jgi:hypothetical protein
VLDRNLFQRSRNIQPELLLHVIDSPITRMNTARLQLTFLCRVCRAVIGRSGIDGFIHQALNRQWSL